MKRFALFLMCIVMLVISSSSVFAVDSDVTASAVWNREGDYYYSVENGEATIESYYGTVDGHITIPETLGGYPVVRIGASVFAFEEKLTGATIPKTVRSLGSNVFYGTRYYYDRANWTGELLYLGDYLVNCGTLVGKIKIKDGTKCIADNTIDYQRMTEIYFPKSLAEIGDGNLNECYKLQKITVEDNNPHYFSDENGIFFSGDKTELIKVPEATEVKTCALPDTVKVIKDFAFYNTGIEEVTLPEKVKVIPNNAFDGCKNLKYIIICGKLEKIGYYAFRGCGNLKYVFFEGWDYVSDTDIFNGNEQLDKAFIQYGFKDGVFIDLPVLEKLRYGDRLVLDLIVSNGFDSDRELVWSTDSESITLEVSEDRRSCTVIPNKNGKDLEEVMIEVYSYDDNGNAERDAVEITVDCRWFQKIFAFFRMIFGIHTVIYS